MIVDIFRESTGTLSTELVFTCPLCGRVFKHNDYEFPARWEDAIRKHLIKAHNGERIAADMISIPDENPSTPVLQEGGPASPPSHDEPIPEVEE